MAATKSTETTKHVHTSFPLIRLHKSFAGPLALVYTSGTPQLNVIIRRHTSCE